MRANKPSLAVQKDCSKRALCKQAYARWLGKIAGSSEKDGPGAAQLDEPRRILTN
jgi:hypothetical protein